MHTDYITRLGEAVLPVVRRAIGVIQQKKADGKVAQGIVQNPCVRKGFTVVTPADLPAQRVYTSAFGAICPEIQILAEEKDPLRPQAYIDTRRPVWVIDGLDGSKNFSAKARFGYGTQCALLLPGGRVPIALVGNAITGDIFGYYGRSGVFCLRGDGSRLPIRQVLREKTLVEHKGWRRPSVDKYHTLTRKLFASGNVGHIEERVGGIGTTMAELLTDEAGFFALRPHRERPWDAVPAYAICEAAGMLFMTPAADGNKFVRWRPVYTPTFWKREFDLVVFHRSRTAQFNAAMAKL